MITQRLSDDGAPLHEAALLRKNAEAKVALSVPAMFGAFVLFTIAGYFLFQAIPNSDILVWLLLLALALCLRIVLFRQLHHHLHSSDLEGLLQSQSVSLGSSMLLAAVVGSGLWFAGPAPSLAVSLAITGIVAFYFVSLMAFMGNDFKSFVFSAPLLMLQPAVYWAVADSEGPLVAFALISLLVGGLFVVRQTSQSFGNSIAMRFEKDQLVEELKQSQQATLVALDKAERANREKAFFMASASHDLRQPLFAIQMVNQTMLLQKLPENVENLLNIQARSIVAMTKLFNNVLDLAQFDSHKVPCTIVEFNLRDAQATMCDEFATMARSKGLKFRYDLPNVAVRSDFDLICRALRNIINNAINYTLSGEVSISGNVYNGQVMVSIHDTGCGIHEVDQRRIFAEFVQLSNESRTQETGLGVGLAIVKQIDEMLDLNLQLRSEPGVGSTFSFSLPQATAS